MRPDALRPYEHSLVTGERLALYREETRSTTLLDVARWRGAADPIDLTIVGHVPGPVLDIGCGPGRITEALNRHGSFAIGIDISAVAVDMARRRGVTALRRDVFGSLPGEGRWNGVVLLDGNIGIGGDPETLLRRVHELLAPGGVAVVETHPRPTTDERLTFRFTRTGTPTGEPFGWAVVGSGALALLARRVDLVVTDEWVSGGRSFTVLRDH